ncbi:MAG: type II toxin-antitoxin system VapC family toxin [Aquamicrobium sp.]|nr:type II toxin-antitoxin system VapC family toxin [Aquamicrobium sp.]
MFLVDTSVWIDHLRGGDDELARLLQTGLVATHPLVVGELAMGNLRARDTIIELLQALPQAVVASDDEVLAYVSRHRLFGLGIGYADAHLLASTQLTAGARLWTRDRRLRDAAGRLDLDSGLD